MIKVSVMYPNGENSTFNIEYYRDTHMPMVMELVGDACKKTAIDEGLAGGAPDQPPMYMAIGHLYFDSIEKFESAFGPHMKAIQADIPNYTNTSPTLQISRVID